MDPIVIEFQRGDDPPRSRLYYGQDCRDTLRQLPDQSVHTICTSPPYWGLRDYGNPPSVWGGDKDCVHEWGGIVPQITRKTGDDRGNGHAEVSDGPQPVERGRNCSKCNAWCGQLGLEPNPEMFVNNIVDIFGEAWRVLRDDGTLWLNMGDSYANDGKWGGFTGGKHASGLHGNTGVGRQRVTSGMKPKELVGIPWRIAFAMQAYGWYLRQDIVWSKSNPMPESVFDRCTRSHEFIFMFTKNPSYYYDYYAIREKSAGGSGRPHGYKMSHRVSQLERDGTPKGGDGWEDVDGMRNKRSVWNVNPKPYAGSHFAVWPEELVESMILSGSSEMGCCSECGAPHVRVINRGVVEDHGRSVDSQYMQNSDSLSGRSAASAHRQLGGNYQSKLNAKPPTTCGWRASCKCGAGISKCVVLDIFSGSATTGLVAMKNGRDYIGMDATKKYTELAVSRLNNVPAPVGEQDDNGIMGIFGA